MLRLHVTQLLPGNGEVALSPSVVRVALRQPLGNLEAAHEELAGCREAAGLHLQVSQLVQGDGEVTLGLGTLAPWMAAALMPAMGKSKPAILAAVTGKVLLPPTHARRDTRPPGRDGARSPRTNCDVSRFKSKILIGAVVSTGAPTSKIEPVVRAQMAGLSACYNTARCRDENLEGRVSVRFSILSNGHTARLLNAGSDLPDAQTAGCVMAVLHKARFPSGEGTTQTTVPFMFMPSQPRR